MAVIDQFHDERSCEPLQRLLHQEMLMFDAVRPSSDNDPGYDGSRRQLLITLLALPMTLAPTLRLLDSSKPAVEKELLARYAASTTAAWHLTNRSEFAVVEEQVSRHLLGLAAMARRPSSNQAAAARLASQAYRILGIAALHRLRIDVKDHYARQALLYARIADDPHLQAAALMSLADTALLYSNDPASASDSYLKVRQHERHLSPLMRSRVHAADALKLAMEGQEDEALSELELAENAYPDQPDEYPDHIYGQFMPGNFLLYRGLTHLALARRHPARRHAEHAWETFERVDGPPHAAVPGRVRVEILNQQAATAIEMRDLDRFATHLHIGVQGARTVGSARRLREALTIWEQASDVWPSERRVSALAELFTDLPNVSSSQQAPSHPI